MKTSRDRDTNVAFLVETDWLEKHLEDKDLVIVDTESDNALCRAYRRAHIKGAVSVVDPYFKDPDDLAHVTSPEKFAQKMSELGIGNNSMVVIYDAYRSLYATRLWLVLNLYGHDKVRVLNGGWNKWFEERRPITNNETRLPPKTFVPELNDFFRRRLDHLKASLGRKDTIILDVRHTTEYLGDPSYRPTVPNPFPLTKRRGHVPGAVHLEANYVLTEAPWTFMPLEDLRQMFLKAGVTLDKEVITYCEHGTRSAQAVFVLRLLGYEKARIYDGGWMDWGCNEDLPLET